MGKGIQGLSLAMHLPTEVSIRLKKKTEDLWTIQYCESFDYDIPTEHAKLTIDVAKSHGVDLKQDGRTFSYTQTGSREALTSVIGIEFLAQSQFGKMTLNEILTLMAIGLTTTQEKIREHK